MVLTCRKVFGWLLSRNVQILFVFHQRILHWEIAIKEFFLVYDMCIIILRINSKRYHIIVS